MENTDVCVAAIAALTGYKYSVNKLRAEEVQVVCNATPMCDDVSHLSCCDSMCEAIFIAGRIPNGNGIVWQTLNVLSKYVSRKPIEPFEQQLVPIKGKEFRRRVPLQSPTPQTLVRPVVWVEVQAFVKMLTIMRPQVKRWRRRCRSSLQHAPLRRRKRSCRERRRRCGLSL